MENEENQPVVEGEQQAPEVLYAWQALEFERERPKSTSWYLVVGLVWLGLVAYSVWTKNWIQTALAVMLGVVVLLLASMKPRQFQHQLTTRGIKVGAREYDFAKFRSFAIVNSGSTSRLLIVPKQTLGQGLSLQLGGADVERIRALMLQRIPEETREEDLVDKMNRWLKF